MGIMVKIAFFRLHRTYFMCEIYSIRIQHYVYSWILLSGKFYSKPPYCSGWNSDRLGLNTVIASLSEFTYLIVVISVKYFWFSPSNVGLVFLTTLRTFILESCLCRKRVMYYAFVCLSIVSILESITDTYEFLLFRPIQSLYQY